MSEAWRWLAVSAVVSIVGSCSSAVTTESSVALPPPPQKVDVGLEEYRFVYDGQLRSGRVVFRVANTGKEIHRLGLFPLPDDMPEINAQLHGEERRPLGDATAHIAALRPGQRQIFAVDLVAGRRYAFLCVMPAPDEESHAFKGMAREFRPLPEDPKESKP